MKVSVIIPVHNAENHITKCIENCKKQTFQDFEVLFIDDCSTDKTAEIISDTKEQDCRFRLFSLKEHLHQGYARNVGLQNSKGDYIVFFDVDDEYSPTFIEKMYNKITQDNADMTACKFNVINEELKLVENHEFGMFTDFPKNFHKGFNYSQIKQKNQLFDKVNVVWDKIYDRNFLKKHNIQFPEKNFYKEDVIFTFRCIFRANKISILNESLYTYKINPQKYNKSMFQKEEIFDCFEMLISVEEDLKALKLFDKFNYAFMNYEIYSLQYFYKILEQSFHEEFFYKLQKSYEKYRNIPQKIKDDDPVMCSLLDKVLKAKHFSKEIDEYIKKF